MKQLTYRALTLFLLIAMIMVPLGKPSTFFVHANEEETDKVESTESVIQETEVVVEEPNETTEPASEVDEISTLKEADNSIDGPNTNSEPESYETEVVNDAEADNATTSNVSMDEVIASSTSENATTSPNSAIASSSLESTTEASSSLTTSTETVASTSVVIQDTSSTATSSTPAINTTITTGAAVAMANVLSIVNTNLVNSTGEIIFSNMFEDQTGGIDFRNSSGTACQFLSCGNSNGVEVRLLNDAHIRNAIMLDATTGNNLIDGANSGVNGNINTGDAYTGLNLINVANTNFIDSNYLLVTLNAFRNVNGDIIFPGFIDFFNQQNSMTYAESTSSIYNDGSIENNLEQKTQTGNNQTESSNGGVINSGTSNTTSNIFNQLNSSLIGGNSVSILLRVHGSWLGEVFGMPTGLNLVSGDNGYYYISDTSFENTPNAAFSVNTSNTATIYNDVSLTAVTGNNVITGVDDASITTGNAYIGANIVNIANANVIGRNWTLAIINIFGDFKGNISFGQPDLWIGEQVEVPKTINNGSEVKYVFTVINNGDAPATNINLVDAYDASRLDIIDASHPYTETDSNTLSWNLGELSPGEATEISYRARVVNTTPGTNISNTVNVTLHETDGNYIDNSDTATIQTTPVSRSSSVTRVNSRQQSTEKNIEVTPKQIIEKIKVDRSTPLITLSSDNNSTLQELVLRNPQDLYLKDVLLMDVLYDPNGVLVKEEIWEIGDVLPYEEITLSYEMEFTDNATRGKYTLTTIVLGAGGSEKRFTNNGQIDLTTPNLVTELTAFEVLNFGSSATNTNSTPEPVVLGTNTSNEDPSVIDESSLKSLLSTPLAYAQSNDFTQHNEMSNKHAWYAFLIILSMLFLIIGLYRYLFKNRSR